MIQIVNKHIPVDSLDGKLVSGESRIEQEIFAIPWFVNVDMSQLSYTIKLKSMETNEAVTDSLDKIGTNPNGDRLLRWEITEKFTRGSGRHRLEINGISVDGETKYRAVSSPFTIVKGLGSGPAFPSKTEAEVMLDAAARYAAQADIAAQRAKEQADRAEKIAEDVGGIDFETDDTLSLENGILSVNTANTVERDNKLPVTSAAVHETVGNIEILLGTI